MRCHLQSEIDPSDAEILARYCRTPISAVSIALCGIQDWDGATIDGSRTTFLNARIGVVLDVLMEELPADMEPTEGTREGGWL